MPLEAPELDSRKFEDLFEELRLRIPGYTPEWTDFNDSDPGITMLQLFAWLSDMMLFQMNQVPDRNYIKFLQLLNMELEPAQPAVAHLTFTPQVGASVESVPQYAQISAQPPDGGDPVVFETEKGLDLIKVLLTDVQVYDGASFTVVTPANDVGGDTFRPFGWVPQVGSALYLGFTPADPPSEESPFPRVMRIRSFLPAAAQAGVAKSCTEVAQPPRPPVELVWEYKPTPDAQRWQRLNLLKDETAAFTREGYMLVAGPTSKIALTHEGKITENLSDEEKEKKRRYWLRCRLESGSYPAGQVPEIDFIRPNTVKAVNLSTVRDEVVGASEGVPDQTFQLSQTPVDRASLKLEVEGPDEKLEPWELVDDFLASAQDDKHYTFNPTKGEIRFGDGRRGRIPVAGADIVAREYRHGGGDRGNVPHSLINAPLTGLGGVEAVANLRPAVGGRDEQKLDDLKEKAPARLRHHNRAVTADDFSTLAAQAGGVAKAIGLPLAHPDHPEVEVPGAITVVVVPHTKDKPPKPSGALIEQVCRYLDKHRLLTTEVYVKGPTYLEIKVEATISARPHAAFDQVAQNVIEALNKFLDPMEWPFGDDLHPSRLYDEILDVPDVRLVEIREISVNGQPHDGINQRVRLTDDELVYGTAHEISVVPHEDL
jgi:predicted phage baseplate assembly protein